MSQAAPRFSTNPSGLIPPKYTASLRQSVIGFVADRESAAVLRQAFAPMLDDPHWVHTASFGLTLEILAGMREPAVVIVDISEEEQALDALSALAEVILPGTVVLAIGNGKDIDFYRTVTKGMGVHEYLAKPLTVEAVTRHFIGKLSISATAPAKRGGRVVAVAGTQGGVGVSTIAANLAWLNSREMHRHTLLLDTDLHTGTVALDLNVKYGPGLRTALEGPERIDQLLLERAAQPVTQRLSVLAAMEPHDRPVAYEQKSATLLAKALRQRYGLVIADCGARFGAFPRDVLQLADQIVLVMEPGLAAVRNLDRLLDFFAAMPKACPMLLVLNRAGRPGGLNHIYLERSLGIAFDAVIPDLPKLLPRATQFGETCVAEKGPFQAAMTRLARMAEGQVPAL